MVRSLIRVDFIDRHRGFFVALFAIVAVAGLLLLIANFQTQNTTQITRINQVSLINCERADIARFQSDAISGVDFDALSAQVKGEQVYLKHADLYSRELSKGISRLFPRPLAKAYAKSVSPTNLRAQNQATVNSIDNLAVLPPINCALLQREGAVYQTPPPVKVGVDGKLNPNAKPLIKLSNRILSTTAPLKTVQRLYGQ